MYSATASASGFPRCNAFALDGGPSSSPAFPVIASVMPLPLQIPVRYSDEDAGYLSMSPVVKQTFRLHELVDMVVSVVGKDPARVQRIFHTGSVVYNGF